MKPLHALFVLLRLGAMAFLFLAAGAGLYAFPCWVLDSPPDRMLGLITSLAGGVFLWCLAFGTLRITSERVREQERNGGQ